MGFSCWGGEWGTLEDLCSEHLSWRSTATSCTVQWLKVLPLETFQIQSLALLLARCEHFPLHVSIISPISLRQS